MLQFSRSLKKKIKKLHFNLWVMKTQHFKIEIKGFNRVGILSEMLKFNTISCWKYGLFQVTSPRKKWLMGNAAA